ncbi:MAG: bifunctional 3-demethylubiquinol 3-O-methyltransferase/2-polyprenyl-6-hydroxyphenol methylase [Alphaproteobacteria bacterium CG11_big_fil_rev_8_21_14_0_20_44_7]|nr:MAG: bifunctional 3-demethylubiquinol 3-O-methyltransferase/2-polyprenyl-6-hydroxyphenol methylase [Alphaproteobacteria bacterium CG11_big_fil_rev_8_21_14_0_20_44_7]
MAKAQTIDESEVEKFSRIADEWWDEKGKFRPLHLLNPLRIKYIRDNAIAHFKLKDNLQPLKGLKILDIGCGGGLLSVPMARLGADVTGVDASEKNIKVAQTYADREDIKINFVHGNVENLKGEFDIILNMEVVEHVADVELFLKSCANLLKPKGMMFLATINRTPKSYLFAIIGAEYILRILPKGTHDWKKFLKPSEVNRVLENDLQLEEVVGVSFNPVNENFKLTGDTNINYMMKFVK